ncbi:class I SAM-dependent methyltransferase [Pseudomonas sp. S75]|uniref:class I SAM-dependent methyltransferase n=1 Tax=unclassified Pseudomonas TaxID=196821 RepID=UPI00190553FE|nr:MULTISPECIES: class I SAM-dependent methyltransferase [unclassified Pseudomonas]MBJ9975365.1 class I SAM-dependent methyltransferase [Pseudomonas sp. S30]MBK0152661.1 class I SAM-dependent methyltransferase [Pseudomonas sp. S75]
MPNPLSILEQHLLTVAVPSETRRLFHGRGRCWPGLEQITVDWVQGVLLVALFREPAAAQLAELESMLNALAKSPQWTGSAILLQHRYLPDSPGQWLIGEPCQQREVVEDGLKYLLDLGVRRNNGLFLDMRYGRRWVREQAAGKRVLNLFAYTCGFSVAAIAGGAQQVVNLDMAKSALSRGRENHRLNGHDASRVAYLGHELFKSWGKVRKYGPYDMIIIDPPTFQRGSFVLTQDYAKVLRRLPELLSAGGTVLACVNDPAIGPDFLIDGMREQAPELLYSERLENPPEFPDADPQGGLKALVFRRQA